MRRLLRHGRLVDPSAGIDDVVDVLITDGTVAEVGKGIDGFGTEVIDCAGLIIAPGFIDLHCHLRDPGLTHKESIATGTLAAARGGFTTVCCMPNTDPVIDTRSVVEYVVRTARSTGVVRVLPIGAVSKGQRGEELAELADLADSGAVAFSDDGRPVATSALMRNALGYSRITGRPVIDHCEDLSLTRGAPANDGPVASRLGLRGWPAAGEEIAIARDLALLELAGGRLHIAHLSTAGGVDLVRRAKHHGLAVTAEVTPHHLTLTDDWLLGESLTWPAISGRPVDPRAPYDTRTKVNPPLRSRRDVEALIAGVNDGTIDAIATDHAPHDSVDKAVEYDFAAFGISGFETALAALLSLVETGQVALPRLIQLLTAGPRAVLGATVDDGAAGPCSPGTLRPGALADIAIIDPKAPWTVSTDLFASKGKNSPLDGITVRGRVRTTLVGGEVVYHA